MPVSEFNRRHTLIEVMEAQESIRLMAIVSMAMAGKKEDKEAFNEMLQDRLSWVDTPPPMPDSEEDPRLAMKKTFREFRAKAEAIARSTGRGH